MPKTASMGGAMGVAMLLITVGMSQALALGSLPALGFVVNPENTLRHVCVLDSERLNRPDSLAGVGQ